MSTEPLDLDAIHVRERAATPGPWIWDGSDEFAAIIPPEGYDLVLSHYDGDDGIRPSDDDGQFIAAARTDVPALLAEVRRLRAQLGGESS